MSKFFDSDIIQEELEEIENLQEFIYNNILNFGMMNRENKLKHIDKMTELLEKQRIMYVRLSLSDDEEAIEMIRLGVKRIGTSSAKAIANGQVANGDY